MDVNKALEKKKNSIMETKNIKEMTKEERKTLLVMKLKSYIRIVDTSLFEGDASFASYWFDDIKYTSNILKNILNMEDNPITIDFLVRFT